MEGRCDEYLASRAPKPIAHITEVEEQQIESKENVAIPDEETLNNKFIALSLGTSNEIHFSTYAFSSFFKNFSDQPIALSSTFSQYNSALDSACTNHIFRDHNLFHTYDAAGAVPIKQPIVAFSILLESETSK